MPIESHTTDAGAVVTTWVCRRCGFAYPRRDLVEDLCPDCIDDDEWTDDQGGEDYRQ